MSASVNTFFHKDSMVTLCTFILFHNGAHLDVARKKIGADMLCPALAYQTELIRSS